MMYEYSEESNPLPVHVLPHLEVQQDTLPIKHPFVPRICRNRGYFFLWKGDQVQDADLISGWLKSQGEEQWLQSNDPNEIIKGVALVYPYEDHTVIGSVKLAGYMRVRTTPQNRKYLKNMWADIITMFGNKPIVCPSGGFFENLHIQMNQKRIPHDAYHWKIMKQHQFKRSGDYWIRT